MNIQKILSLGVILMIFSGCTSDDDDIPKENRVSVLPEKLALMPSLSGEQPVISQVVMNSDWLQAGGLPFRDLGNLMGNSKLTQKWTADVGDIVNDTMEAVAQPVVSGGYIYVLNADAELICLEVKNGKEIWRKNLVPDDEEDVNPRGGGIATEGEFVFVTTGTGMVYGLSATDGKVIWKIDNRIPFGNSPTLSNGRLYVIDRDNRLQVIDAVSGKPLWDYRALPEPASYPRIAAASVVGNVIIAPFTSGEIVALDDTSAKPAWGRNIVGGGLDVRSGKFNTISAHPVISDQMVFVSVPSGMLGALRGSDGNIVWSEEIALERTPLAVGDTLYAIDMSSRMIAMRKTDGKIFYVTQLPDYGDEDDKEDPIRWSSPLMLDGTLISFSNRGAMISLDPRTGKIIKSQKAPSTSIDPVVAGGVLYIVGRDGTLYAYGE